MDISVDISEVTLNLVPKKKRVGSKNLCSTGDQVAKLFSAILGTRLGGDLNGSGIVAYLIICLALGAYF
jgi:hypothetical protein